MTIEPQSDNRPNTELATANLGLVRPPLVYLTSLLVGVVIQLVVPLPFLSQR